MWKPPRRLHLIFIWEQHVPYKLGGTDEHFEYGLWSLIGHFDYPCIIGNPFSIKAI